MCLPIKPISTIHTFLAGVERTFLYFIFWGTRNEMGEYEMNIDWWKFDDFYVTKEENIKFQLLN